MDSPWRTLYAAMKEEDEREAREKRKEKNQNHNQKNQNQKKKKKEEQQEKGRLSLDMILPRLSFTGRSKDQLKDGYDDGREQWRSPMIEKGRLSLDRVWSRLSFSRKGRREREEEDEEEEEKEEEKEVLEKLVISHGSCGRNRRHTVEMQLELSVISAQDLHSSSGSGGGDHEDCYYYYAVVQLGEERAWTGGSVGLNPAWNARFAFRVGEEQLRAESVAAVTVEIYRGRRRPRQGAGTVAAQPPPLPPGRPRQRHLAGTVRVLLSSLAEAGPGYQGAHLRALQIRRPSGRPQGILNIASMLLNPFDDTRDTTHNVAPNNDDDDDDDNDINGGDEHVKDPPTHACHHPEGPILQQLINHSFTPDQLVGLLHLHNNNNDDDENTSTHGADNTTTHDDNGNDNSNSNGNGNVNVNGNDPCPKPQSNMKKALDRIIALQPKEERKEPAMPAMPDSLIYGCLPHCTTIGGVRWGSRVLRLGAAKIRTMNIIDDDI